MFSLAETFLEIWHTASNFSHETGEHMDEPCLVVSQKTEKGILAIAQRSEAIAAEGVFCLLLGAREMVMPLVRG